jgi:hypothetical protein
MAIRELGIKKVAYSTKDRDIVEVRPRDIDIDTIRYSSGYYQDKRLHSFEIHTTHESS